MLLELGELREAKLWAERGLDIHRDHAGLLASKAVACARAGELEAALVFCDAAMGGKEDSPFLWLARGEALLASRGANHEYCFMKARSAAGGDWFILLLVARLYAAYGDHARAYAWVKEAAELSPTHAFTWLVMGQIQKALGLEERAASSLEQASTLDESCRQAIEDLRQLNALSVWARLKLELPTFRRLWRRFS
jgi:tetratricopeptide (TPR) repeat protein